jgi:hypothetical protein
MFRRSFWTALALTSALGPAAQFARADSQGSEPLHYASRERYSDPRLEELRFRHRQLEHTRRQLLRELDHTLEQRRWRRAQQVIGSLARVTAQLDRIEAQLPQRSGPRRGRDG